MWVALVIYLPAGLLAPMMFAPIFGSEWSEAGRFAAVLAPSLAVWTVASPLTRLFVSSGRHAVKVGADVANLLLPVGALLWARDLGPLSAIAVYSAASCLVAAGVIAAAFVVAALPVIRHE
jgi:O-antigen/teichoic acid export membrane protein